MKKTNIFLMTAIIIVLLSIVVWSQISPVSYLQTKNTSITPTIKIEETKTCTTTFYNQIQDVYGNCVYYSNYTSCLNTSGPSTDCSLEHSQRSFSCKTGETIIVNNRTECKPDNKFLIVIDKGNAVVKNQIDSSDWGPCVYTTENNCLIVTCVSIYDGAHKGQFTDCNSGKSCEKFEICDNSVKTFYKNSRDDFAEDDTSFHLNKLSIQEVGQ
ncbi:MAG TPA: hypothetical protein VJJ52_03665 [Candidatus Nanoarchaeia archaeon]|nr:hypothetical protein [Candidatus Nanoarchaeia archaeon]